MLTRVGDYLLFVEFGPRLEHQERFADLAETLVGYPDHRGLGDPVEPGQHLFDLGRIDVEAAADVHVLEPVGDRQVAVLVQSADVPGVQPALGIDGLGGRNGIVEVAEHDVGSAQQYFTGAVLGRVVDAQLEVGDRAPGGGGDGDRVVVGATHRAEA